MSEDSKAVNTVTDPIHYFRRVHGGEPQERYDLVSQVRVNGQLFTSRMAFPFEMNEVIMKSLERAEVTLSRAVGEQIIRGYSPQGAKK